MLSLSAETTGRRIDVRSIADPAIDSLVESGAALSALGRLGSQVTGPDAAAAETVASELGPQAASDAAAVAAAFEGLNRIVDGVGLPIGRAERRDEAHLIEALGLDAFPHASHGA
jgi:hypothetical protein